MNIRERLSKLRELMAEKEIDMYIIPTADFHQSEYVGEYFKARKFMTGFSGSAGTAVVTKEKAYEIQKMDGSIRCNGNGCKSGSLWKHKDK